MSHLHSSLSALPLTLHRTSLTAGAEPRAVQELAQHAGDAPPSADQRGVRAGDELRQEAHARHVDRGAHARRARGALLRPFTFLD